KRAAIAEHHSYGRVVGDSAVLSTGQNVLIERVESYYLLHDPFLAWSRLGLAFTSALAVIGAGFLTLVGTLLHNQAFSTGAASVPSGAILGLVMLTCYLLGMRF